MERIIRIISSEDFNIELTNLLIDLYSFKSEEIYKTLELKDGYINECNEDELINLTKLSAVIEYVGNQMQVNYLPSWIYDERLRFKQPYIVGVDKDSIEWVKRFVSAPREFKIRNVYYDVETLKPI